MRTGTACRSPLCCRTRACLRPAHGRWIVQQPGPGPGRIRRLRPELPAAARPGVPQRPGRRHVRSGWAGDRRRDVTNTNYASTLSVADADPRIISNLIVDQTITNPVAVRPSSMQASAPVDGVLHYLNDDGTTGDGSADRRDADFSRTRRRTRACRRRSTPGSRSSASSSITASTWSTRAATARSSFRCSRTIRSIVPKRRDQLHGADARHQYRRSGRRRRRPRHGRRRALHNNETTPFVDQNQTYTSHASHQVFLREYDCST